MDREQTLYEQLGGMEPFRRIVDVFYDRVGTDTLLRPMFPGSLHCARINLALFLAQFFGGPADYAARRGSPRLRMRHLPFEIGQAERDRWLFHMLAAVDEVGIPEPARTVMIDYLTTTSTFLINHPTMSQPARNEPVPIILHPAVPRTGISAEVDAALAHEVVIDRIISAIQEGSLVTLTQLLEEPAIRDTLAEDRVAYRDILSHMLFADIGALADEARARLEQERDLVHVRGGGGITLLHEAAGAWNSSLAEFLIDLGANVNVEDGCHSPLYYAANRFMRRDPLSPEGGGRIASLLLDRGADPNACSGAKRVTPLHMAARRGNTAIARVLIEHGANLEARDSKGETPLRRAVNCGHREFAALLLAHGAAAQARANDGQTPLQAARTQAMREVLLADPVDTRA